MIVVNNGEQVSQNAIITTGNKVNWLRIILSDIIILTGLFVLPALAHLSPMPIYYLDPMRLFLLIGYAFSKSKANIIILAILMPFISYSVSGHPEGYKALLIGLELITNLFLLNLALKYISFPPPS